MIQQIIDTAIMLNNDRVNVVGSLCKLENNLKEGKPIDEPMGFLSRCIKLPGIRAVIQAIDTGIHIESPIALEGY